MPDEDVVLETPQSGVPESTAPTDTTSEPGKSATPESEDYTSGEEDPSSTEQPEIPKAIQKQLDKLKRQRYEAKRVAERERRDREYWQQQAQNRSEPPTPTVDATIKPTVDKFTTYEDYLEALSDWKVEQKLSGQRAASERDNQAQVQAKRADTYQNRVRQAEDKYEDYQEIAHGDHWMPSPQMVEAIQESELGPDLAYWLGGHPEDAERIASLSPVAQYREIGKLEERLSRPPARKTTDTPAPIEPAGAKAKAHKEPHEMTPHEFSQWRKKYIAQRR